MSEIIGIVCAGDEEVAPFLSKMTVKKIVEKAMLKFYVGIFCNRDVVVVCSGVCKVNAAIATEVLIDSFLPKLVINAGVAGAMDDSLSIFDVVIGDSVLYHDVESDISTEFHPWLKENVFPVCEYLLKEAKTRYHMKKEIHFGTMVTGERFIDQTDRKRIVDVFHPLSVDMESASVAHVCYVNQLPCFFVRTISDTPVMSGEDVFEKNCRMASVISMEIVSDILENIKY